MLAENIFLVFTVSVTTLNAGLFWGWAVSVIPGTKRISDMEYLNTMQSINKEILNPLFLSTFVGSSILLIISAVFFFGSSLFAIFLLLSTLTIVLGQFIVTISQNVPLNNRLDKIDLSVISKTDASKIREWYEGPWNKWHYIRSISSVIGLIFLIIGIVSR